MDQSELWHRAIHEAGHAVCALTLGGRIFCLTIKEIGGRGGAASYELLPLPPGTTIQSTEAQLLESFYRWGTCALGGVVAEELLFGQGNATGGRDDYNRIYAMWRMQRASADERTSHINEMRRRAEEVLKEKWSVVETVAKALIEREVLDAAAVQAIVLDEVQA